MIFSMDVPLLAPFLITTLLIELTPGPNMAWLMLTSASHGRRAGLAATAGIATGLLILGVFSALGLAALANRSPYIFGVLRYAGAAYLLFLAWQTWAQKDYDKQGRLGAAENFGTWFRHGLFLNILNPKAAVFFITVLPTFISVRSDVPWQTSILTACYLCIATLVHAALVLMAGQAHDWAGKGSRKIVIRRIFAVLLASIAIWFFMGAH
jgi:threonine/homoserine/homoserine lactone efflux protein